MTNVKNGKKARMKKYNQKRIDQMFGNLFVTNAIIVAMIIGTVLVKSCENNQIEGGNISTVYESSSVFSVSDNHDTVILPANDFIKTTDNVVCELSLPAENSVDNENNEYPEIIYSKDWSSDDAYLLAKIAMAEAEGESLETKVLVILTVLNRVHTNGFPNSIEEVIFENRNGTYQFTPISNGRWKKIEPNEECWKALEVVYQLKYDISNGALFFEACKGDSWHSRNLELICQSDNTRFYK